MEKLNLKILIWTSAFFSCLSLNAQSIPVQIVNESGLSNDSIYVAIVGQDLTTNRNFIWVDVLSGQQNFMSISNNTVQGPIYGGNGGPGNNGMYADCFSPLSAIPNQTIPLDMIQGCRIFISQKSQLYLYFFNQTSTMGYTAPNLQDPTDPNKNIVYEIIELTLNAYGFFGNTTRVDAYHRPIKLELFGESGAYQEIRGDLADHTEIISNFPGSVPSEFQNCLDLQDSIIIQPSKISDFQTGGPFANYFDSYVNDIWSKYKTLPLIFDGGDIGIYSGIVDSQDSLIFECIQGSFSGRKGRIAGKPSTIEIIEGSGKLASPVVDAEVDLNVQKMVCAAINRHVIDITTPNPGMQIWSDSAVFYQQSPANFYAGYWHQQGISIDKLSYGFAYDDVFDQSSSLHTANPDSVKIYYGNSGMVNTPELEVEWVQRLKVYPNMTHSLCTVSGIEHGISLKIIGLNGIALREITLDQSHDKVEINLSHLTNGLYLIHVKFQKRIGLAKVIKM